MTLLEGWTDQTVFLLLGPEEKGIPHSLTIRVDSEIGDTPLAEYGKAQLQAALEGLQGAEVLKQETKALPGGTDAFEGVFKWIPVDDQVIFRKMLVVQHGEKAIAVSGNFSKRSIQTLGAEMDTMVATLNLMGME